MIMNKHYPCFILLLLLTVLPCRAASLGSDLSGRILIQVESKGEAWYVNPLDQKKYYLGRPTDAFNLMKKLAIGITNDNLNKVPISLNVYLGLDDDQDGLVNNLEKALGTDPQKKDSDNDGFDDRAEIINNYNPTGQGKFPIDLKFTNNYSGRLFLQVEKAGQCWYINPTDKKRYFLGSPTDAFNIMKKLGIGITNDNLNKIETYTQSPNDNPTNPTSTSSSAEVIKKVALLIQQRNLNSALNYFTPELRNNINYNLNAINEEGLDNLADILGASSLISKNNQEEKYSTYMYYKDSRLDETITLTKQTDGSWLISEL